MEQVKDLTELTLEERWSAVKDDEDWWDEIKPRTLAAVKVLMEEAMEVELVEELNAAKYRRTEFRRGYRNGYRYRGLLTELGPIEQIQVPRDRDGQYLTQVLHRYERRQSRVNQTVREMFLAGVSTRRVREVIEPLLGGGVSAQSVSRICRSLDAEVQRYHRRDLADCYQYLLLDGIVLKVKGAAEVKRRVVLCAYGITHDGVREMIDFRQASSESEAMWTAFWTASTNGDSAETGSSWSVPMGVLVCTASSTPSTPSSPGSAAGHTRSATSLPSCRISTRTPAWPRPRPSTRPTHAARLCCASASGLPTGGASHQTPSGASKTIWTSSCPSSTAQRTTGRRYAPPTPSRGPSRRSGAGPGP